MNYDEVRIFARVEDQPYYQTFDYQFSMSEADGHTKIVIQKLREENNSLRDEIQKLRDEMVFLRECFEGQTEMLTRHQYPETENATVIDDVNF